MGKSILYKLLGLGKVPSDARVALEAEGILCQEEGLSFSTTYRNYRGPGAYYWRRYSLHVGALVVTRLRIVAFAGSSTVVNLPQSMAVTGLIEVASQNHRHFRIAVDAAKALPNRSGMMIYRFRTDEADRFMDAALWTPQGPRRYFLESSAYGRKAG